MNLNLFHLKCFDIQFSPFISFSPPNIVEKEKNFQEIFICHSYFTSSYLIFFVWGKYKALVVWGFQKLNSEPTCSGEKIKYNMMLILNTFENILLFLAGVWF